jgi:hypothetical protein
MRQQNHASPKRGISKMKSQGSAPEAHKTLQSQNRPSAKNRLAFNGLEIVHARLITTQFQLHMSSQFYSEWRANPNRDANNIDPLASDNSAEL